MDDELDALGNRETDLEEAAGVVGADDHREVVEGEDSDWAAVGVEDLFVGDAVLASARDDHRIHDVNLP